MNVYERWRTEEVVNTTTKKKWWPLGGTKGWTSDAGWGCMLRGQSLLAVALGRVGGEFCFRDIFLVFLLLRSGFFLRARGARTPAWMRRAYRRSGLRVCTGDLRHRDNFSLRALCWLAFWPSASSHSPFVLLSFAAHPFSIRSMHKRLRRLGPSVIFGLSVHDNF
ncbi:hypothetical protein DFH06DRAFT_685924 [Mycena polygramma]|nr:hypothetical protein DFH06DRAFT_685924 [Mycena polygramma]